MWARIGDVVGQDKVYTIDVLLLLLSFYEEELCDLGLALPIESLCSCVFLLLTCPGYMQGYEVVLRNFSAIQQDV